MLLVLLGFLALLSSCGLRFTSVDAMFMWTAPLPAWNQTIPGGDSAKSHTTVVRVRNGSAMFNLTWRYLLDETQAISLTTFIIVDGINLTSKIGVVAGGVPTVVTKNDYNNRFEIQSNAELSSLAIKSVTEREKATFQCNVLLTDGNEWAYNVRIEVTGPPEITKPSKGTWEVTTGESVNIECHARGNPRPQYVWRKAGGRVVVDGKLLHFEDVNTSHGGNYTCTAWNSVASANVTVLINVQRTSTPKNIRSFTTMVFVTGKEEEKTATDNTVKYILIGIGSVGLVAVIALAVCWCIRKGRRGRLGITEEEPGIEGFCSVIHQWIGQTNPERDPRLESVIVLT